MPFGTIVSGTKTFEARSPGEYVLGTVTFGQPLDKFTVRGAVASKDGIARPSVTRVLEKDVVVAGQTTRKQLVVTLSIATPMLDFTGANIDDLVTDVSTFLTPTTVSRLLQGES